ncbi:hypothetical protein [Clostridium magnum]|uniref:Phage integrase family protein n=1 Tax=Clostridium magnum DSM 2767 TaxID=1121326 RepID=A0A162R4S6_9CLOT|nr:hypothetical protein [Clostridium magnum]KZL89421.1 phage integrase family protein [Clostridium magnum DSM 2767]SHI20467.1 hypothetical protein SAMN02745944_03194 [Clostridium magnum DSM 2767]
MKNAIFIKYLDQSARREFNKLKKIKKEERELYNFKISTSIWFKDMIWNFNYANEKNRIAYKYRFDYNKIPAPYQFYVKATILNKLLSSENRITGAYDIYAHLKTITRALYFNNITDIRLVSLNEVKNYINSKFVKCGDSHIAVLVVDFKKFIEAIDEFEEYNYEDILGFLNNTINKCWKSRPQKAENDYIPFIFLNQIVSLAIRDIDNENLKMDDRIVASLIVLMAETGMRAEEVTLVETNKLDSVEVNGKEICYLKFLTFKTQQNEYEGRETYTWLTEKALKAYRMCESFVNTIVDNLSEESRLRILISLHNKEKLKQRFRIKQLREMASKIDDNEVKQLEKEMRRYLFISDKYGTQKRGSELFRENIEKFFVRHEGDFDIENIKPHELGYIKQFNISSKAKYEKFFSVEQRKKVQYEEVKDKKYLYVNPHMFRVTVCTKLFLQGVHIDFIIKHMNHLEEDMSLYYYKSEKFVDELEEGAEILSGMLNKEGVIITNPDLTNDSFIKTVVSDKNIREKIEKINSFLEKSEKNNHLNIKDNFKNTIRKLEKTDTPIVENEFGVCVKSVIFGICEKRKYFSTLSDNYFIGIQLPTYRYIHYSYERFRQKVEGIEHNRKIAEKDDRYSVEYEREKKVLAAFIKKTLNTEINLLDKDIQDYGIEMVIEKHPDLKSIIENLEKIRKEIQLWML